MTRVTWESANRNPSADNNPLDLASYYVEELKYGPGAGKVERAGFDEVVAQMEALLREANVESMTGEELVIAAMYYGKSISRTFQLDRRIGMSLWLDGLMHGIALAGDVKGEHRNPRGQ